MTVGLAGYAMWRLVRAGIGHGTQGRDTGLERVAGVASGVTYAALCVTAVKILTGASSRRVSARSAVDQERLQRAEQPFGTA